MKRLTKREEDVMTVFWELKKSLTIRDVVKHNPELSQNTVQVVLKNLVEKKCLEFDGTSIARTAIARVYKAIISEEEYFQEIIPKKIFKKMVVSFVTQENSEEELKKIEDMVQKKLKEIRE
ncbi:BlaI/MecI/CopY family transcriptional regulator [Xylocopilactobacillus apicola]|uniref:Penicillinase repressor n=1 Tax=Xylocopilactobacillus apicola TaxID=2932184 RepID=A0AAU9D623_9LACO|nr:BlaI/MecI/CopY family transcriptional regulator [Xylocopilactobacillus apicola]BDR59274.1 hypothetical protein XA3_17150 [Xylocopilactobacillus apicola]